MFCGCLLFDYDNLLLSVSFNKLYCMLDLCMEFAVENDTKFNHLKSHRFQVRLVTEVDLPKLNNLSDKHLVMVKELIFLGVTFVFGKYLTVNISLNCRKYLGASLAILQKCKFLAEDILCYLILKNYVPTLRHGLDSSF